MTIYFTKIEIVEAAAEIAEKAGFVLETTSSMSEAIYLAHPEKEGLLRIACHSTRHPFNVRHSINIDDHIKVVEDEFGDEEFEIEEWKLADLVEEAIDDYMTTDFDA